MRAKEHGRVALSLFLGLGFYFVFLLLPSAKSELDGYKVSAEHTRSAERFTRACQASPSLEWSGCVAVLKNGEPVRVSAKETWTGVRVIIHNTINSAVDGNVEKITGVPMGKFLREGNGFVFEGPRFYSI